MIVSLAERPAYDGGHAQHIEEITARPDHFQAGCSTRVCSVDVIRGPGKCVTEKTVIPDLLPRGVVEADVSLARSEQDEALGLTHRQGLEQQAVNKRKDRRIGADAKGNCQKDSGTEESAKAGR